MKRRVISKVSLIALGLIFSMSGCSYKAYNDTVEKSECVNIAECAKVVDNRKEELGKTQQQIDAQNKKIAELKSLLEKAKGEAATKKTVVVPAVSSSCLYPPNAKPGECYARVLIPAKYETKTEKVLKKEAGERLKIIPPKYRWTTKKVLVKEAGEKIVTIPAKYKTVTEKVLVKEAGEKVVQVPAVYETVTERVLIKPSYTTWKKGQGPIEKVDSATGEIMCLVEVPAQYKTITKRILKKPATTKTIPIPAEYRTVTKKVLVSPATTKVIKIPAVYKTIKVKELVEPAKTIRIAVPEEYQTITKRYKVSDAKLEWRPILCKTNFNAALVKELQRKLKAKGFNPGPIDGIYGWRTKAAVNRYQKAKGLPTGALTIETLRSLGISN